MFVLNQTLSEPTVVSEGLYSLFFKVLKFPADRRHLSGPDHLPAVLLRLTNAVHRATSVNLTSPRLTDKLLHCFCQSRHTDTRYTATRRSADRWEAETSCRTGCGGGDLGIVDDRRGGLVCQEETPYGGRGERPQSRKCS